MQFRLQNISAIFILLLFYVIFLNTFCYIFSTSKTKIKFILLRNLNLTLFNHNWWKLTVLIVNHDNLLLHLRTQKQQSFCQKSEHNFLIKKSTITFPLYDISILYFLWNRSSCSKSKKKQKIHSQKLTFMYLKVCKIFAGPVTCETLQHVCYLFDIWLRFVIGAHSSMIQ